MHKKIILFITLAMQINLQSSVGSFLDKDANVGSFLDEDADPFDGAVDREFSNINKLQLFHFLALLTRSSNLIEADQMTEFHKNIVEPAKKENSIREDQNFFDADMKRQDNLKKLYKKYFLKNIF